MNNLIEINSLLSRNEMRSIKAGNGFTTCYICLGGVDCSAASQGQSGRTGCEFVPYPEVTCDMSGSSCTGTGEC